MKTNSTRFDVRRLGTRLALAIAGSTLICSSLAKSPVVTLPELVKDSQVIVLGSLDSTTTSEALSAAGSVRFAVSSILKGEDLIDGRTVFICTARRNSEWPDLSRMVGRYFFFLNPKGDCYAFSHGYRSVVKLNDQQAHTVTISDQPEDQLCSEFLEKIRTLIAAD